MSSADPNQHHQQSPTQYPDDRYPQSFAQNYLQFDGYYGNFTPAAAPYVQPYYASTAPAPFVAELPAPMPPAPSTSTSKQQLNSDELLAHKLQQLEVEEVRRRSSSNIILQQRPVSFAPASPSNLSLVTPQPSFQSLRTHSQSLSAAAPYSPESFGSPLASWRLNSFGPPSDQRSSGSLPEVVAEPYQVPNVLPETPMQQHPVPYRTSSWDNMPIPVEGSTQRSVAASLDTSSLSAYLEKHHQVPYPPQWSLPPAIMVFHADIKPHPKFDWLDTPETAEWRIYPQTEQTPPSYTFKFKDKGGSFRDPRHSWTMTYSDADVPTKKEHNSTWVYDLKLSLNTGVRKTETLTHGKDRAILPTYVHALNYDSLRFIGPDGRAYMWVSQHPVSSIGGTRWDTLRHALFVAGGNIPDPLYGHIVADHAFWDGSGEEALCIRSLTVDVGLVVASLQVLKDWEKHTLREEKKTHPKAFWASEEAVRREALGKLRYWRAGDGEAKGKGDKGEKAGQEVKRRNSRKDSIKSGAEGAGALGILAGAGLALAGSTGAGGRQSISGSLLDESR